MSYTTVRRAVWGLLILVCLGGFSAVAQEAQGPVSPGTAGGALIAVIAAPPSLAKEARGLSILLENVLARAQRRVVLLEEIEAYQRSSGFWRQDGAILVKDIPALAKNFGASALLQGWLEESPQGWRLQLRHYEATTGQSVASSEINGRAGDVAWFLENSMNAAALWLGGISIKRDSERWAEDEGEALALAELSLAKEPFNEENQLRLATLLAAIPGPQERYSKALRDSWARKLVAGPSAPTLARALHADLSDEAEAVALYDRISSKEPAYAAAKLRQAALLERAGQSAKALGVLRSGHGREPGNAAFALALAQLALRNEEWKTAEALLARLSAEASRAEPNRALAAGVAGKPAKEAALIRAVQAAASHKMFAQANGANAALVEAGGIPVVVSSLDAGYLREGDRLTLAERLAPLAKSRESLLAAGALLDTANRASVAGAFYERAAMIEPFDAKALALAGAYFAANAPGERKGLVFLRAAVALEPEHPAAGLALAQALCLSGQCAEGLSQAKAWTEHHPVWLHGVRSLAACRLDCQEAKKAEAGINNALADFPDDAELLALKVRALVASRSMIGAQLQYAHLKMVDIHLAERLGPPRIGTIDIKLAAPSGEKGEKNDLSAAAGRVQEGGGKSDFAELESLQQELGGKLAATDITLDLAGMADLLENTPPEELEKLGGQLGIKTDIKSAQTQLQRFFFKNLGAKAMLPKAAGQSLQTALKDIAARAEKARAENASVSHSGMPDQRPFLSWLFDYSRFSAAKIAVLLSLLAMVIAVLALAAYVIRRLTGTGGLTVMVYYNRSFHAGRFIGVLSKKEQQHPIRNLNKGHQNVRSESFKRWKAFVEVLFPFRTVARRDLLTFRHIIPGEYFLTVASIQIDAQTELPIGSIEVRKRVVVRAGSDRETIRFEEEVAYIGVKVESLLQGNTAAIGAKPDLVSVSIEGASRLTEKGEMGEEIAFYLPRGDYIVRAQVGTLTFRQELRVEQDLRPQWVRFRLEDQRCVVPLASTSYGATRADAPLAADMSRKESAERPPYRFTPPPAKQNTRSSR